MEMLSVSDFKRQYVINILHVSYEVLVYKIVIELYVITEIFLFLSNSQNKSVFQDKIYLPRKSTTVPKFIYDSDEHNLHTLNCDTIVTESSNYKSKYNQTFFK